MAKANGKESSFYHRFGGVYGSNKIIAAVLPATIIRHFWDLAGLIMPRTASKKNPLRVHRTLKAVTTKLPGQEVTASRFYCPLPPVGHFYDYRKNVYKSYKKNFVIDGTGVIVCCPGAIVKKYATDGNV